MHLHMHPRHPLYVSLWHGFYVWLQIAMTLLSNISRDMLSFKYSRLRSLQGQLNSSTTAACFHLENLIIVVVGLTTPALLAGHVAQSPPAWVPSLSAQAADTGPGVSQCLFPSSPIFPVRPFMQQDIPVLTSNGVCDNKTRLCCHVIGTVARTTVSSGQRRLTERWLSRGTYRAVAWLLLINIGTRVKLMPQQGDKSLRLCPVGGGGPEWPQLQVSPQRPRF